MAIQVSSANDVVFTPPDYGCAELFKRITGGAPGDGVGRFDLERNEERKIKYLERAC